MLTHIDLTVSCQLNYGKKETLRIYYVQQDSKWMPLPVNICDNGCGSPFCQDCTVKAFEKAASLAPR